MIKVRARLELEINLEEVPANWKDGLKDCLLSLDGKSVYFGTESRGIVTVKNIEIEEF